MNIEELTIKQARELTALFSGQQSQSHPYKIGSVYQIRTVTNFYTGRLTKVFNKELVLEDAAWIADTGRFSDACKTQSYNEIEPYPDGEVVIGRGSIVDACVVSTVNRSQK